jgi:hypothetical protein
MAALLVQPAQATDTGMQAAASPRLGSCSLMQTLPTQLHLQCRGAHGYNWKLQLAATEATLHVCLNMAATPGLQVQHALNCSLV